VLGRTLSGFNALGKMTIAAWLCRKRLGSSNAETVAGTVRFGWRFRGRVFALRKFSAGRSQDLRQHPVLG